MTAENASSEMASDPGEFRMPLEDVEGRDGKSL